MNLRTPTFRKWAADHYKGEELRGFQYCRVTIQNQGLKVEMVKFDAMREEWEIGDVFTVENSLVAAH